MPQIDLPDNLLAMICYVLSVEANRLERIALAGKKAASARSKLRDVNEALARMREAMREE
jgi:hypothetical protein